jgi:hypothetical protein
MYGSIVDGADDKNEEKKVKRKSEDEERSWISSHSLVWRFRFYGYVCVIFRNVVVVSKT